MLQSRVRASEQWACPIIDSLLYLYYPCLLVLTYIHNCLPIFTRLLVITTVYSCLPMSTTFICSCLPMFTHVYSCLLMFALVELC